MLQLRYKYATYGHGIRARQSRKTLISRDPTNNQSMKSTHELEKEIILLIYERK